MFARLEDSTVSGPTQCRLGLSAGWSVHLKFRAACPQASRAVNSSWYLLGSLAM